VGPDLDRRRGLAAARKLAQLIEDTTGDDLRSLSIGVSEDPDVQEAALAQLVKRHAIVPRRDSGMRGGYIVTPELGAFLHADHHALVGPRWAPIPFADDVVLREPSVVARDIVSAVAVAWRAEPLRLVPQMCRAYIDAVYSDDGRRFDNLCQTLIGCGRAILADQLGRRKRREIVKTWNTVVDEELSPVVVGFEQLRSGRMGLPDLAILHLEVTFLAAVSFGITEGGLPEHLLALYGSGALPTETSGPYPYCTLSSISPSCWNPQS